MDLGTARAVAHEHEAWSNRCVNANARAELLDLLTMHSFRQGDFLLSSGQRSDFFIDCKPVTLTANGHVLVGALMLDEILGSGIAAVAVAGVELGGCSLASAVAMTAHQRGAPLDAVYVRKSAKEHGTKRLFEGASHLAAGAPVVVVEDTITTGGSSLRAVEKLREAGFEVPMLVALVDRREGGAEAIEREGIKFVSLFNRGDFIR